MEEYKPGKTSLDKPVDISEEKRFEPVNEQSGEIKKRSLFMRAIDEIFHFGDKPFIEWAVLDVLVPSFKDTLASLVKNGADILFYGSSSSSSNKGNGYSYNSYQNYYDNRPKNGTQAVVILSQGSPDYRDVTFENYGKAMNALNQLRDATARYGFARVGDLMDLANITPEPIDYKHGWPDLRNARVSPAGGGRYRLELPAPAPID